MSLDCATEEQWRPVHGYAGFYEISDRGRMRALWKAGNFHKAGRILKPWVLRNGYLQVHLKPPKVPRKAKCIHVMILEAFVGPEPDKEVRHLNGNRMDNRLRNLAWGTHQENVDDSRRHGTMIKGERAGSSKLTEAAVLKIRKLWSDHHPSLAIAALFGIDRTNVWQIVTRRTWRHI